MFKLLVFVFAITTVIAYETAFQYPVTCPPFDPSAPPVYEPDPYYCDIFYECSGSTPFQFHCAPGTNFDIKTNLCEFNVDCGDRSTTVGTTTEGTQPPKF
ncbi:U-scoloptoxin(01)-Tl1a-like [Diabrotica virgifera virgifera]|uniref:Chitin-binding domain protein cbd-1-like n=1 Tax=Diabrotica virgifera virgifera TaxID=50390 RepID=A0A6P7FXB4_DIAVI|nr:U-scoloptoxin(01)-Tl1a-like [Diabrotica virgifera virgifera]